MKRIPFLTIPMFLLSALTFAQGRVEAEAKTPTDNSTLYIVLAVAVIVIGGIYLYSKNKK
jgi:hypothetical protein